MRDTVPHSTVSATPLRFADHIDAEQQPAFRTAVVHDAGDNMARAMVAAAAGDVAEFARCLRFAADSAALAVQLGATPAEVAEGIAKAREEAAR
jgi:hypothetical protein